MSRDADTKLDISVTADCSPGRLIHDAHVLMRSGLGRALQDAGYTMSVEEWAILSHLWQEDELSQLEIAERVSKDRHHVSRLLDGLEEQGLVARKKGRDLSPEKATDDRRVNCVCLTDAGRAARVTVSATVTGFFQQAFSGVSPEAYQTFLDVLRQVIVTLRAPG